MTAKSTARNPSPLACIPCRERHLKCDALTPICSRCDTAGVMCHYVSSKRGMHPRRKAPTRSQSTGPSTLYSGIAQTSPFPVFTTPNVDSNTGVNFDANSEKNNILPLEWLLPEEFFPSPDGASQLLNLSAPEEDIRSLVTIQPSSPSIHHNIVLDPMIQLYYKYFHTSHPIVIPRKALGNASLVRVVPPYLLFMMQFLGAHFHPDPSAKDRYQQLAYLGLNEPSPPTAFKVKAMLLAAIADHAHGNEEQAGCKIQAAIDMANQLGMQNVSFAGDNSFGSPILEESWRRTYWESFVVGHLFKTFSGRNNCHLQLSNYRNQDLLKMGLPCDESTYFETIPKSQTLHQMQNDWRSPNNSNHQFSPFAYRIEAARLWLMVQSVNSRNTALLHIDEVEIETLDARLTSLMMRLTSISPNIYRSQDGDDQMRAQAQMITSLAIIYLHHPQSNVRFGSFPSSVSCIKNDFPSSYPSAEVTVGSSHNDEHDPHTFKVLRAAGTLLKMIPPSFPGDTHVGPIQRHSPFMICALAVSVMVHAAAAAYYQVQYSRPRQNGAEEEFYTPRIELGIRTLDVLGEVWPLGYMVKRQLLETITRG